MHLHTDVLVVGGGTAGVTAAIAAASRGANVILAEFGTTVGGVGTSSGIHAYFMGLHVGTQLELDKKARGLAREWGSTAVGFHPEAKKIALLDRLIENKVRILYQSIAVEVMRDENRVAGVKFETPEGPVEVTAFLTLDSTGNGDVGALAGCSFTSGREWDGGMQCFSVTPRFFKEEDKLAFNNYDAGWVDSTCSRDVSRALLEGRKLIWKLPELADNHLISIASLFGAREGRLMHGEYTLTLDDLIMDRRFDDVVMKCYSHYDNHATDMANESRIAQIWTGMVGAWNHRLGCDIPYRSFLPIELNGLLIACRALSMDHDTSTSFRMQPDMHAVGEVTGMAAAICVEKGIEPRHIEVSELQHALIQRGVIEESDLTRPSAPWVTLSGDSREDGRWTLETARQPESIKQLIEALGTDDEGSALWWLWKSDGSALPLLIEAFVELGRTEGEERKYRRGLALALALLGDDRGVPILVQSVRDRDNDALPGYEPRIPPRWIASLLAIQGLKNPACADILIRRLPTNSPTNRLPVFAEILYTLHYLIEVADGLAVPLKEEAIKQLEKLMLLPGLGDDWYSGGGDCSRIQEEVSIRWNIELTAIYAKCLLGQKEAIAQLESYQQAPQLIVRNMVQKLKVRLQLSSIASNNTGKVGSA